jgi:hypothetical protein
LRQSGHGAGGCRSRRALAVPVGVGGQSGGQERPVIVGELEPELVFDGPAPRDGDGGGADISGRSRRSWNGSLDSGWGRRDQATGWEDASRNTDASEVPNDH